MEQTQLIQDDDFTQDEDDNLLGSQIPVAKLKVFSCTYCSEREFMLFKGDNAVGRHESCRIHIPAPSVSKKHAVIEIDEKSHIIYDCRSLNKTRRKKGVLKPDVRYFLEDRDLLMFADVACQYIMLPEKNSECTAPDIPQQMQNPGGTKLDVTSLEESEVSTAPGTAESSIVMDSDDDSLMLQSTQAYPVRPLVLEKTPAPRKNNAGVSLVKDSDDEGSDYVQQQKLKSEFSCQEGGKRPNPTFLSQSETVVPESDDDGADTSAASGKFPALQIQSDSDTDIEDEVNESSAAAEKSSNAVHGPPCVVEDDSVYAIEATQCYVSKNEPSSNANVAEDADDAGPEEATQAYACPSSTSSKQQDIFKMPLPSCSIWKGQKVQDGDVKTTTDVEEMDEDSLVIAETQAFCSEADSSVTDASNLEDPVEEATQAFTFSKSPPKQELKQKIEDTEPVVSSSETLTDVLVREMEHDQGATAQLSLGDRPADSECLQPGNAESSRVPEMLPLPETSEAESCDSVMTETGKREKISEGNTQSVGGSNKRELNPAESEELQTLEPELCLLESDQIHPVEPSHGVGVKADSETRHLQADVESGEVDMSEPQTQANVSSVFLESAVERENAVNSPSSSTERGFSVVKHEQDEELGTRVVKEGATTTCSTMGSSQELGSLPSQTSDATLAYDLELEDTCPEVQENIPQTTSEVSEKEHETERTAHLTSSDVVPSTLEAPKELVQVACFEEFEVQPRKVNADQLKEVNKIPLPCKPVGIAEATAPPTVCKVLQKEDEEKPVETKSAEPFTEKLPDPEKNVHSDIADGSGDAQLDELKADLTDEMVSAGQNQGKPEERKGATSDTEVMEQEVKADDVETSKTENSGLPGEKIAVLDAVPDKVEPTEESGKGDGVLKDTIMDNRVMEEPEELQGGTESLAKKEEGDSLALNIVTSSDISGIKLSLEEKNENIGEEDGKKEVPKVSSRGGTSSDKEFEAGEHLPTVGSSEKELTEHMEGNDGGVLTIATVEDVKEETTREQEIFEETDQDSIVNGKSIKLCIAENVKAEHVDDQPPDVCQKASRNKKRASNPSTEPQDQKEQGSCSLKVPQIGRGRSSGRKSAAEPSPESIVSTDTPLRAGRTRGRAAASAVNSEVIEEQKAVAGSTGRSRRGKAAEELDEKQKDQESKTSSPSKEEPSGRSRKFKKTDKVSEEASSETRAEETSNEREKISEEVKGQKDSRKSSTVKEEPCTTVRGKRFKTSKASEQTDSTEAEQPVKEEEKFGDEKGLEDCSSAEEEPSPSSRKSKSDKESEQVCDETGAEETSKEMVDAPTKSRERNVPSKETEVSDNARPTRSRKGIKESQERTFHNDQVPADTPNETNRGRATRKRGASSTIDTSSATHDHSEDGEPVRKKRMTSAMSEEAASKADVPRKRGASAKLPTEEDQTPAAEEPKSRTSRGKKGQAVSTIAQSEANSSGIADAELQGRKSRRSTKAPSQDDNQSVHSCSSVEDGSEGASSRSSSRSRSGKSQEDPQILSPKESVRPGSKRRRPTDDEPAVSSPEAKTPRRTSRAASSITSPRANGSPSALKIMFTGVVFEDGERVIQRLGGEMAESVHNCTHVITDRVRRTVKFLCAVAKGIPIVTLDWLKKSEKSKRFLSCDDFLVNDVEQEKHFDFSLSEALLKAKKRSLLQGYEIHITPGVKPEPVHMKEIIQCSGGTFLPKMPRAYKDKVLVVSCPEDLSKCKVAMDASIPVVGAEFILTGILQQSIDVEKYRLEGSTTTKAQQKGGKQNAKTTPPAAKPAKRKR
ncbi:mediator of DNA damage checkpoint protein 1 [Protopterus annectens]|uniref:mediator of DNA damage checkpoint protein 1 n=1 Tax=Protopterus annectens TaxID=7888 RepID=UPI001CFA7FA5|nr:mediator of DNA damage checkpoint protein 1 [Protopterus annectens]